jgi:hypothetical protein
MGYVAVALRNQGYILYKISRRCLEWENPTPSQLSEFNSDSSVKWAEEIRLRRGLMRNECFELYLEPLRIEGIRLQGSKCGTKKYSEFRHFLESNKEASEMGQKVILESFSLQSHVNQVQV